MPKFVLFCATLLAVSSPAFAGGDPPIPGPLAGASFGPAGLIVAALGYAAYRVIKARSDR